MLYDLHAMRVRSAWALVVTISTVVVLAWPPKLSPASAYNGPLVVRGMFDQGGYTWLRNYRRWLADSLYPGDTARQAAFLRKLQTISPNCVTHRPCDAE